MVDRIAQPRPKVNVTTSSPTATDDASKGYQYFSIWYNSTTDELFICVDPTTGSAVWNEIGTGGGLHVDTVDPTSTDDVTEGYQTGSLWLDTANKTVWVSYDDTAADAKWYNYNNYAHRPYLVGPATLARFQTIGAAVVQAVADGASTSNEKDVWILPGTFVENLTLVDGINLHAVKQFPQRTGQGFLSVKIQGAITSNPVNDNHLVPTQITGIKIVGPSGVKTIQFASTTKNKVFVFSGCRVESNNEDVIDFGSPTTNLHKVFAFKSIFGVGTAGNFRVALIPDQAEVRLVESEAVGGLQIPAFVLTPAFVLEDGGFTAVDSTIGGGPVTNAGFSANLLILVNTAISNFSATPDDVTMDGACSTGYYERGTFGYNGRFLVVGGAQASTFTERPVVNAGEVQRYDGERWLAKPVPSLTGDYDIPALTTTGDGQIAMTPAILQTPENDVFVRVNSILYKPARNQTEKATSPCYFSSDGGGTVTAIGSIAGGSDKLYWNGSVTEFQLAPADRIDLVYEF